MRGGDVAVLRHDDAGASLPRARDRRRGVGQGVSQPPAFAVTGPRPLRAGRVRDAWRDGQVAVHRRARPRHRGPPSARARRGGARASAALLSWRDPRAALPHVAPRPTGRWPRFKLNDPAATRLSGIPRARRCRDAADRPARRRGPATPHAIPARAAGRPGGHPRCRRDRGPRRGVAPAKRAPSRPPTRLGGRLAAALPVRPKWSTCTRPARRCRWDREVPFTDTRGLRGTLVSGWPPWSRAGRRGRSRRQHPPICCPTWSVRARRPPGAGPAGAVLCAGHLTGPMWRATGVPTPEVLARLRECSGGRSSAPSDAGPRGAPAMARGWATSTAGPGMALRNVPRRAGKPLPALGALRGRALAVPPRPGVDRAVRDPSRPSLSHTDRACRACRARAARRAAWGRSEWLPRVSTPTPPAARGGAA